MATNFEYYKDEILKYVHDYCSFPAAKNGRISTCGSIDCNNCDFNSPVCFERRVEWLYAEHIEQPKLTKRERAFCEAFQTGWIAKDSSDVVCWYANLPVKGDGLWVETGVPVKTAMQIPIDFWWFDFIKWEDEKPWSIEELLKLDVIEEVQEDA